MAPSYTTQPSYAVHCLTMGAVPHYYFWTWVAADTLDDARGYCAQHGWIIVSIKREG